jgi:NitT/TauT family transport system substrate-binding protein
MTKESFDRLQDVIIQAGEISEKVDFNKIVDNTFAEKVSH